MSMWEPKLELDPLCSLRPLLITCGPGGKWAWESDALAAACTMRAVNLSSGFRVETPHAGLCWRFGTGLTDAVKSGEKEGRATSPSAAAGYKLMLFTRGCSGKALGSMGRSQTVVLASTGSGADCLKHPKVLRALGDRMLKHPIKV